jgi:hypothetical protein
MTSTSDIIMDLALLAKKYEKLTMKKGGFNKEGKRNCYNCDEPG